MAVSGQRRRPVVALYERIADAVHDGTYPPGSTLPSEPKLAAELGVSRPALREALLLLQEDGVLTVRRGVGRTVNDRPPRRGFEHVQPLEELIGGGAPLRVRALLRSVEEPTDFTTQHLLAPARAELRFWESVLTGEGAAAALSHEWAAPDALLDRVHPEFARALREAEADSGGAVSMLAVLVAASRETALNAHSGITATLLGRRRGEQLGRPADTPAVLVTQVVRVGETPVLAAKHMLPTGTPALPVLQSH
ncbi:GntR family transcriptional regulator [Streptomyces tanashiensis]|uniref:GntR family transcriptional regulator n=1 Tax=Streptomyces tanashiensis TaxID=67367 RepID=A0ABY6QVN4_9ACTN|nr:GntR family transcriptional regulator [Streptomyces tanashiensis]UZX20727.1 GntR family transcriptional regulator [Streptomyces tanashiensis]GGS95962.1 putative HTH-type transcriptional regulator [Streptomyces tanashiensis]GGY36749.1 putative HTH-type transcriptional regulator [Streptomyces tanashiensis]